MNFLTTGLMVLMAALFANSANAQTENLRPEAAKPARLFIRQPSASFPTALPTVPERTSFAAESASPPQSPTQALPLSPFQFIGDKRSAKELADLADLALPQVPNGASIAELAVPSDASAVTSNAGNAASETPNGKTAADDSGAKDQLANTANVGEKPETASDAKNKTIYPSFFFPPQPPVQYDGIGSAASYDGMDFMAAPLPIGPIDPRADSLAYRGRTPIMTQRPWVELGRPLYTAGMYPPANSFFFGETNLLQPHFYVYGDYRTAVGVNQNQNGPARSWAQRLNLDMDLQLTATERFHAFMGPLDRGNDFTRIDFSDSQNVQVISRTDMRVDTLFFEGDLGAILGGREGTYSPFDLPISLGLMPLVYQNGIWMEDAMLGAACAIPTQHSTFLDWPNYEVSLFALTDQVTTDAFKGDNNAAEVFGSAWFIEAYDGYIEADHAFVHDDVGGHRSYHNASLSFTRRYLSRLSNSVRVITNFGQALPSDQRTADGYLLLLENSLISANPNYFVPYANFFYGSGKPQSVARAAGSGGILRNTGINFETDGLTAYPTLDATGNNTYGGALGVNLLGNNFSHQLVVELAALAGTGSPQFRGVPGDQYAAGVRYQKPLSYRWIFRADAMYGWLRDSENIYGNRFEFRWKF